MFSKNKYWSVYLSISMWSIRWGGRYSFSSRGSCSSFRRGSNRNNSIFCSRFSHTSHHLGNLGKKIYVNMKNMNECRSEANTNLGLGKYCAKRFKGNYSIFGCSSVSKGKCNCSRSLMGTEPLAWWWSWINYLQYQECSFHIHP